MRYLFDETSRERESMPLVSAGIPIAPEAPEPSMPPPERAPLPDEEPQSPPWGDPEPPGRKINLPADVPPGIRVPPDRVGTRRR